MDKKQEVFELLRFEVVPSNAPVTDKKWTPYRDDKSATHKTVKGKGVVGRLIKK